MTSELVRYLDSLGYTPEKNESTLSVLQRLLRETNNGIRHPLVEESITVDWQILRLDEIHIPQKRHYDSVEPRPLVPESPIVPPVAGVVIHRSRGRGYHLVDGYHRLKYLKENSSGQGLYIVLKNDRTTQED